jgi:hypothetical protein
VDADITASVLNNKDFILSTNLLLRSIFGYPKQSYFLWTEVQKQFENGKIVSAECNIKREGFEHVDHCFYHLW